MLMSVRCNQSILGAHESTHAADDADARSLLRGTSSKIETKLASITIASWTAGFMVTRGRFAPAGRAVSREQLTTRPRTDAPLSTEHYSA